MLSYQNGSDTLVVVLHEIYGINNHIGDVCLSLKEEGYDVICPDLLDGRPPFDYEKEEEAYRYFMNFVGLEASAKRVSFLLRQEEGKYKNLFLLGYSVGATVGWLTIATSVRGDESLHFGDTAKCNGLIGYYGSRIRDYSDVTLECPALLLFGEEEASFRPQDLKQDLESNPLTEVHILKGKHGFADSRNANYNDHSSAMADKLVEDFIRRNRQR